MLVQERGALEACNADDARTSRFLVAGADESDPDNATAFARTARTVPTGRARRSTRMAATGESGTEAWNLDHAPAATR